MNKNNMVLLQKQKRNHPICAQQEMQSLHG